jgi:hypothetical protein
VMEVREIVVQWQHNALHYMVFTFAGECHEFISAKSLIAWLDARRLHLACEVRS